jgi:hypothetical protein
MTITRETVFRSAQRALRDYVHPKVRRISLDIHGNEIILHADYEEMVDEDRRELIECAATEILADLSPSFTVTTEFVVSQGEEKPHDLPGKLIYARFEPLTEVNEKHIREIHTDEKSVLLAAQHALVGRVHQDIRQISVEIQLRKILIYADYARQIDCTGVDLLHQAGIVLDNELEADVSVIFATSDPAVKMAALPGEVIYARFEGWKSSPS